MAAALPIVGPAALGLLDKLTENPAGLARQSLQAACVLAIGTAVILGYRGYYMETNNLIPPPTYYAGSEGGFSGNPSTGGGDTGGETGGETGSASTVGEAIDKAGIPESLKTRFAGLARRESLGYENIYNNWDVNAQNNTPSIGLTQIILPTAKSVDPSATNEKLANGVYNMQIAYKIYQQQGWTPWAASAAPDASAVNLQIKRGPSGTCDARGCYI